MTEQDKKRDELAEKSCPKFSMEVGDSIYQDEKKRSLWKGAFKTGFDSRQAEVDELKKDREHLECTTNHWVDKYNELKATQDKLVEAMQSRARIIAIADDDREPAAMGENVHASIYQLEEQSDQFIMEALAQATKGEKND